MILSSRLAWLLTYTASIRCPASSQRLTQGPTVRERFIGGPSLATAWPRVCILSVRSLIFRPARAVRIADTVLELHEFLTMLVRIGFFRANPQYGMRKGKDQKNADKFGDEVPLPGCLADMLTKLVLPNARRDTYAQEFVEKTLPLPEVQSALSSQMEQLKKMQEGDL